MEVILEGGQISNDVDDVLRVKKSGYETLSNPIAGNDHPDSSSNVSSPASDNLDTEITIDELFLATKSLRHNKSYGLNGSGSFEVLQSKKYIA